GRSARNSQVARVDDEADPDAPRRGVRRAGGAGSLPGQRRRRLRDRTGDLHRRRGVPVSGPADLIGCKDRDHPPRCILPRRWADVRRRNVKRGGAMSDSITVIDVDSHVTEPPDLWTSRLRRRFAADAPHVEWDPDRQRDRWHVGRHTLLGVQDQAHAGWKDFYPSTPSSFEEAERGGWDASERLKVMDAHGIGAQILYPNLLGFFGFSFMELEPALGLACVRAFNDFQFEWSSADPRRLFPLAFLPFWDVEASAVELRRCAGLGFRGFNWGHDFEKVGLPALRSPHWDPLMNVAQELEMPVSFHI